MGTVFQQPRPQGAFPRLLVYEREGILLVEVYESVGLLFRYVKRPKRAHRFIPRL